MQTSDVSFRHLGLSPKMLEVLAKNNLTIPTPVQHKVIPIALEGKDVVAVAQTGTGKTLAFGIPLVQQIATGSTKSALVLAPTRDLALQVDEVLKHVFKSFKLKSAVVIGGDSINRQITALRARPQIIVATPGRLIDHMARGSVMLSLVNMFVLDEADRMFDMGFAPQVEQIIKGLSRKRQTLLFSATIPPNIVHLATRHMQLPIHVELAPSGTVAEDVSQELFVVREGAKKRLVKSLLEEYKGATLIFTRTKAKAKLVTRWIKDMNHKAVEIHSNRTMGQRKQAIEGFKSGRYRILVATDIAARGIDIIHIELVINYDLPDDIENYVHRIGRTGRAGRDGHAITFATPEQDKEIGQIEKLIKNELPRAAHPEIETHEFSRRSTGASPRGGGRRTSGPRSPRSDRSGGRSGSGRRFGRPGEQRSIKPKSKNGVRDANSRPRGEVDGKGALTQNPKPKKKPHFWAKIKKGQSPRKSFRR